VITKSAGRQRSGKLDIYIIIFQRVQVQVSFTRKRRREEEFGSRDYIYLAIWMEGSLFLYLVEWKGTYPGKTLPAAQFQSICEWCAKKQLSGYVVSGSPGIGAGPASMMRIEDEARRRESGRQGCRLRDRRR
jgi:hypothetical protein